jgi:hypothetical protein
MIFRAHCSTAGDVETYPHSLVLPMLGKGSTNTYATRIFPIHSRGDVADNRFFIAQ